MDTLDKDSHKTDKFVDLGNMPIKYMRGGLHSIHNEPSSHVSNDEYVLVDCDVASYYPTLLIQLLKAGLKCPLPNLLPDLERFLEERLRLKSEGKKDEAGVFKIILNSIYGSTSYKFSKIYAPTMTLAVTINGQLMMLDILDFLVNNIKDLSIVWVNTDGFALRIKRSDKSRFQEYLSICEMKYNVSFGTQQELKCIYIGNVNKYISVTDTNESKIKGLSTLLEPQCFNKVTLYILDELYKEGGKFQNLNELTYDDVYNIFLKICDFNDFIYMHKENDTKTELKSQKREETEQERPYVYRYFCSKTPEFYGSGLCIKNISKIVHNFTLCKHDLSRHTIEEVCIDHYVGILLRNFDRYKFEIMGARDGRGSAIWSRLITKSIPLQDSTLPLVDTAYELSMANVFVSAGKGPYVYKSHSPTKIPCKPLDHFKNTLINNFDDWLDGATLHVQDINLLILQVKDFKLLEKYKPSLSALLTETRYISNSKTEVMVFFLQIRDLNDKAIVSISKYAPFKKFFKNLDNSSGAGLKLLSSSQFYGNMITAKGEELLSYGLDFKNFNTEEDLFTYFSDNTRMLQATVSQDVTENSKDNLAEDTQSPLVHYSSQPIGMLADESITSVSDFSESVVENEIDIDLGEGPKLSTSLVAEHEPINLIDNNQKLYMSSKSNTETNTKFDSSFLDRFERLEARLEEHKALLKELISKVEKVFHRDTQPSDICSIEPSRGALHSQHTILTPPSPEETQGLSASVCDKMLNFHEAASAIQKNNKGVVLERNLIVLFMLWVTGKKIPHILSDWTLNDFLIMLETNEIILKSSNQKFVIEKYQRKVAKDIKRICVNYLSISKSSPLFYTIPKKKKPTRNTEGKRIVEGVLRKQLNEQLKPLGLGTGSFSRKYSFNKD